MAAPIDSPVEGDRGRRRLNRAVNRRELRVFLRQLSALLNAGLAVDRAMDLLSRQQDAARAAALAGRIAQRIRQGGSLSEAMGGEPGVFDELDLSVVTAAEASGRMAEAVKRLLDYHQRRDAVADRLRSALIYPLILVIAAVVAMAVLFTVVVPGLAPLLAGADKNLPQATRAVLAVSDFLRHHGWIIPTILVMTLVAGTLPGGRDVRDKLGLALPLVGPLWAKIETERWQRGLGILLANGVPLPRAVQVVAAGFSNQTLKAAGAHIAAAIPQGRGLAVVMAECGCFPTIAVQLVRVGEESGGLDAMLLQSADHQHEEVEHSLSRLIALIEPVLILVLGLAVAAVVLALLSTVTSLNETLVGA
jgi:type II secretory pathway component PulF